MLGSSGIVRVEAAFPVEVADALADRIWAAFSYSYGIERDRPDTWSRTFQKRALDNVAASTLFDEILTDRLAVTVDAILGSGGWDWPSSWGDLLITFPNVTRWTLPAEGWHQDWAFATDCDPPRFVKAFVFLNHVQTGGGGTLVVAGSHRLNGHYGSGRVVDDQGRVRKGSDRLYVDCAYPS